LDDKKAVSERLEASEKQYKYMVTSSPDLIFALDQIKYNPYGSYVFVELKASSMHLPASKK
jgi:hypothetical protein